MVPLPRVLMPLGLLAVCNRGEGDRLVTPLPCVLLLLGLLEAWDPWEGLMSPPPRCCCSWASGWYGIQGEGTDVQPPYPVG